MSTLEATFSILETLSDEELQAVRSFALLLKNYQNLDADDSVITESDAREGTPFAPMSKKQIMEKLRLSRLSASLGNVKEASVVSADLRAKYGL
ncbi:hypothetical protein SAMN04487770_13938 [Butyrivibrio sp. ob235]|uniref:hypothetical protein n=1 Tax=Butyrivibrio sp. ob235 TaxID=1761780 RepID=UPI0008C9C5CF|nr:hypothetical protein [Butyrivibrio sp. ob235]SEM44998.1 hypothetical protein SAMN04487770_13938 [Butyrivibrio sp. ob235]